jgi:NhaP-type Na+/H+ or K+/H+ antiporter
VSTADLAIIAALVFGWGAVSARLERSDMTGPIVFTAAGVLLTNGPLRPLGIAPSGDLVKVLAELTLGLVLFTDASRVRLANLRADAGPCAGLLALALPLTIGIGTMAAFGLPGVHGGWDSLLVGAALAPTDAALGARMIVNPAVPDRIRRLINVESGLNDGVATPFVLAAIAGATGSGSPPSTAAGIVGTALAELGVGLLTGVAVGAGGGWLLRWCRDRAWAADSLAGAAVMALAWCCQATALALHGNGFIAAFVGGLAFATAGGRAGQATTLVPYAEHTGAVLSLLVWLLFGVVAVVPAVTELTWQAAAYAVASLTVIRMLPVAIGLARSRVGRRAVLFVGWFGPRGLASVVFGLLALEDLGQHAARPEVAVISFTVLLSVVAHGLSAEPLAGRYGPTLARSLPDGR